MIKKIIIILGLITSINQVQAQTTVVGQFNTSAQLQSTCSVNIDDINFGEISFKSDKVVLSLLSTTCSKGITAIGSISTGVSNDYNQRYLTDGTVDSDKLNYRVSLPGKVASIGDGTSGTQTITITGTGITDSQWISGIVLRGQYLKPGLYNDTLVFKLTY